MSIYFRFKSNLNTDKVTFDGLHISVGELKRQIFHQKKIGKSNDFDLQISNAETKKVYISEDELIQKNTTVIVARVPIFLDKKLKVVEQNLVVNKANVSVDKIIKSSNLTNSKETEQEKLQKIIIQSTKDYDPSKFIKTRSMIGPNYICHRCGKGGHYIKHCPTNQTDNVKRSTGIPRSFMMPAKADQKGALITATGEYVVPIIDHQAYKEPKKEKAPFLPTENPKVDEKLSKQIPEELQCLLCKSLLHDAVMIPCCCNNYCDECIRTYLLESEQHQCPTCLSNGIPPDSLLSNSYLRKKVDTYKNQNYNPLYKVVYQNIINSSNCCLTKDKNSDLNVLKVKNDKLLTKEDNKLIEDELENKENNHNINKSTEQNSVSAPEINLNKLKNDEKSNYHQLNEKTNNASFSNNGCKSTVQTDQSSFTLNNLSNFSQSYQSNQKYSNQKSQIPLIQTINHQKSAQSKVYNRQFNQQKMYSNNCVNFSNNNQYQ